MTMHPIIHTNTKGLLVCVLLLFCMATTPSLTVVAVQQSPKTYITSLAWSPDGSKIAVGKATDRCDRDNPSLYTIQILDALTGQVVQNLVGSPCGITAVDWSPDSTKLAASSIDGIGTRVWDVQTGQLVMEAQQGGQGNSSVRWRPPDGLQLADAAVSNGIGILDPMTGEMVGLAPIGGTSLDWSPDGSKLVSGSGYENQVYIADMVAGQQIMTLSGHTNTIETVDWSPNGSKLASGSADNTLRIWDASSGQSLLTINAANVVEVRWSPDSQKVATASFDGLAQVWDASTGDLLSSFLHPSRVWAVDWSPDGTQLAYGGSRADGQEPQVEIVLAGGFPTPTPTATYTPTDTPTATNTPTDTPTVTPTPTTVVLTPLNLQGWTFTTFGIPPVYSFVLGPGTPPSGSGSLSILISVSGSKLIMRPPLTTISTVASLLPLRYSTYRSTSLASQFYVNLYLDTDGNPATCETRLDYAPTSGSINTWETWEAGNGTWRKKSGTCFGSGTFTNVSLSQYEAAAVLGVAFNMGDTASSYVTFNGAIDMVTIGTVTYDFELVP